LGRHSLNRMKNLFTAENAEVAEKSVREKMIFVTGLGTAGWFGSNAGMDCRGREVLACLLTVGWAFSMWGLRNGSFPPLRPLRSP
jgi:hypothetical protein